MAGLRAKAHYADCFAAPALFYAETLVPRTASHPKLAAYFEGLVEHPSLKRAYSEVKPFLHLHPFSDRIAARFR
jgi:glutathione S-transferase